MSAASYQNLVQELYVAYFGRPADYFGLQNFEAALLGDAAPTDAGGLLATYSSNAAVKTLVDGFGTSKESQTLYASTTTESFVNVIFENLFNRSAATAGLEFWAGAIDSKSITPGEAALEIAAGAEGNSTAQGVADWQTVLNKIGAASAFTTDLAVSTSEIISYAGPTAAQEARNFVGGITLSATAAQYDAGALATINEIMQTSYSGQTVTLTTAVGTFSGGSGVTTFSAVLDNAAGLAGGGQAQTLLSGDSIVGGPTGNTLALTDDGVGAAMSMPAGVSLSGISQININSLEGVNVDFSSMADLLALNVKASAGEDTVTVANHVAVTVTDPNGDITVNGGGSVQVNTGSLEKVTISSTAARFQATTGNGFSTITDTTPGAFVNISTGVGVATVTLGANATATVTLGAHGDTDSVVLGPSGASLVAIATIGGLANNGSPGDTLTFSGETAYTLSGFQQVTQAQVAATGANPSLLASWVAAADGAAGSSVTGGAHSVTWFQFEGQTFLLESVAGQTADAGTMAAGNTLVELTGTGYTFANTTGAHGTVHFLG